MGDFGGGIYKVLPNVAEMVRNPTSYSKVPY
jgi:hypothetical protein